MNKKNFILLIISLVIILFPNKVVAKESGATECLNKISITWKDGNGNVITDPTEVTTNQLKVEVKATKGKWEAYFGHPDIDSSDELFDNKNKFIHSFEDFDAEDKFTKTINLKDDSKAYVVLFIKLKNEMKVNEGKTVCKAGNYVISGNKIKIESDGKKKGTGIWRTYRISKYDPDIANGVNSSKPACAKMVRGQYKRNGSSSTKDICYNQKTKKTDDTCARLSDYQLKMQNYFPYCFNDTDNANLEFDGKFINEVKQKFIDYYNLINSIKFSTSTEINEYNSRLSYLRASTDWSEKTVNGEKKDEWSTSVGNLSCATSLTTETTNNYFAEKTVLDNSYCKVKCTEEFTTTYSPPVATKAGLCFTYQVTVKSKVNCITEQKSKDIWPKVRVKGCTYKAVCDDGTDQAGPNEEFDSCVKKCDGGKYSQSCINKCYKDVYGNKKDSSNTNLRKTLSNNTAKVSLLANDKDGPYIYYTDDDGKEYNLEIKCSTWSELSKNLQICAEGFKEAKDSNPLGSYEKRSNGGWKWNTTAKKAENIFATHSVGGKRSGAHSVINSVKRAAPYYFRSVESTKVLLKSLFGYGHYYGRAYNIDNVGIKRQASTRYKCEEDCWFKKKASGSCVSTVKEAKKAYDDEISAKQSQIEKCSTTAAELCSTTQATFEIGADNKVTNPKDGYVSDKTFENWNKTGNENKDEKIDCGIDRQSNLLNDIFAKLPTDNTSDTCTNGVNGKCYGTSYPNWEYKTTITFPGAWINLKTGEVEYTNDKKSDNGFSLEQYKYCTMYNSKNTNENWWKWRVNTDRTSAAPTVDDYNIHATVNKFGKFNWNLNFKCFYALSDLSGGTPNEPDTPDNPNTPDNPDTPTTPPTNIDIRFVREDKKLFAGRSYGATGSSRDTGNQIGFNWTSDAQNKTLNSATAKGYDINPYEYGKSIMDENSTQAVYSEEPDVIINLTPDNSKKINQLLKNSANSEKYGIGQFDKNGTWTDDTDIPMLRYYNSKILESLKDIVSIKYKKGYNYTKR